MQIDIGNKVNVASFDVDCQYTFTDECPDELPVPDALSIVDELNVQAKLAQYRIGSKEAHSSNAIWIATEENPQLSPAEGDNVDVHWPPHSIPGTKGFELIEGLPKITQYDYFVWKGVELDMHPYGSCFHDFAEKMSTGIIEFLKQHKVNTVLVGGLAIDYCVKVTVLQLRRAGFKVILNLGASRGLTPKTTQAAISEMLNAGVIIIETVKQLSES